MPDQNWVALKNNVRIGYLNNIFTSLYSAQGDTNNNIIIVEEFLADAEHVPFVKEDLDLTVPNVNNTSQIEWIEPNVVNKKVSNKDIIQEFFEIYNNDDDSSIDKTFPCGMDNEYIYAYKVELSGLAYKFNIITFDNKY